MENIKANFFPVDVPVLYSKSLTIAWLIHEWTISILSAIIRAAEFLKQLQSCKMETSPLAVALLYKHHSGSFISPLFVSSNARLLSNTALQTGVFLLIH